MRELKRVKEENKFSLKLYSKILKNKLIKNLYKLIKTNNISNSRTNKIIGHLIEFAEEYGIDGNLYQKYILFLILLDENPYSLNCERGKSTTKQLENIVKSDFKNLYLLYNFKIFDYMKIEKDIISSLKDYQSNNSQDEHFLSQMLELQCESFDSFLEKISEIYKRFGCGQMLLSSAFYWEKSAKLLPVRALDPITLDQIFCYDYQKSILIKNTENFINSKPANNVLLYGARGTGKSSLVKSLLNEYSSNGLRIVEVLQSNLGSLPLLIEKLSKRGGKFIIYIDDISFESFETEYKVVKSILEGGLESISDNMLIYATSNRRHILSEKWQDRNPDIEEVFRNDTESEQLSLSDRFGISLQFQIPGKNEYLEIVKGISQKFGFHFNEDMKSKALKWAQTRNGFSGRTAKQFINDFIAEYNY